MDLRRPAFILWVDGPSARMPIPSDRSSSYRLPVTVVSASMPWLQRHARYVDAVMAGLLSVLAQIQVPSGTPGWVRASLLLATAAVGWRRARPFSACLVVAVGVGMMAFTDDPPSVFGEYLAVLVIAFTVSERLPIRGAVAGGLLLALGVIAHDWQSPEYGGVAGAASDLGIPVVLWGLGRVVRFQRGREESSRRQVTELEHDRLELARRAVAEERAHLARELHDVVTHSVSMMVIQAQGAQRVLGDGHDEVRSALVTIETGARTALTDMRRLLGLIDVGAEGPLRDPQPVLAELVALVDRVRATGLPVTLTLTGPVGDVGGGVGLSAFRVVQEALTNSLQYAGGAPTRVTVTCSDAALDVVVEDDGPGGVARRDGGRGLVGMGERVALYGGTLEAGPRTDGPGFRVHAVFPREAS